MNLKVLISIILTFLILLLGSFQFYYTKKYAHPLHGIGKAKWFSNLERNVNQTKDIAELKEMMVEEISNHKKDIKPIPS
ncbi:MAG: hypothetical protein COB15_05620 [Flavobacteriales bacterium]|nr:MAG: hypothetical protein COB15_05620 [Flavobacteriales bacterium]